MSETRLPVLPLVSGFHREAESLFRPLAEAFRGHGQVEVLSADAATIASEPAHVLLVLSGGTEGEALAFAEKTRGPIILLSHPGHNSLPAALEIAARLRQDGRIVQLVHLGADARRLSVVTGAIALARGLRGMRVGLIGAPSPWLVASSPAPSVFQERLGVEVVSIPLEEVLKRVPSRPSSTVEGIGQGVSEEEREMGARVHAALLRIVEEEHLDALSIACFGLLPHRMTACWALSRLSDVGLPGGCEGDLPALLALMVAQELTGGPGFLANPADVDLKRETLTLAHCTVPLALTCSHVLRTHFESGLGLAVAGDVKPGAYTLVRFGGRDLGQGFFVEGNVLSEPVGREDLCRTQLRFKMPRGAIERLLREPLGNHHVLIPGSWRAVLSAFQELFLAGNA